MGKGSGDDCRRPMWMQDAVELGGGANPALYFGRPAESTPVWSVHDPEVPYAHMDPDGTVYDIYGDPIGTVDDNGQVVAIDGYDVGWVTQDGEIYNVEGTYKGRMAADGTVYDERGDDVGWVDPPILFAATALVLRYLPGFGQEN